MLAASEKSGVKIRHAVASDTRQVTDLLELLSPSGKSDPSPDAVTMAAALSGREGNTTTLVAEDAREGATRGQILGTCSVVFMQRLARGGCAIARLEDVVTAKAARGRGVAATLCEAAKAEAARRGAYALDLRCVPKLVKYYGKFGWTDAGCAMRCNL